MIHEVGSLGIVSQWLKSGKGESGQREGIESILLVNNMANVLQLRH